MRLSQIYIFVTELLRAQLGSPSQLSDKMYLSQDLGRTMLFLIPSIQKSLLSGSYTTDKAKNKQSYEQILDDLMATYYRSWFLCIEETCMF